MMEFWNSEAGCKQRALKCTGITGHVQASGVRRLQESVLELSDESGLDQNEPNAK